MTAEPGRSHGWPAGLPAPIDVILDQAEPEALTAARALVARDLGAALVLAETIDLIERCRGPQLQASPRLRAALSGMQGRLQRQQQLRQRRPWWPQLVATAAAAAVAFAALVLWDPMRPDDTVQRLAAVLPERVPPRSAIPAVPEIVQEAPRTDASELVAAARQRPDGRVRLDLASDPLAAWVDPTNMLGSLRLDFERRDSAELRRRAQQNRGGLPEVEDRVQQLADGIAGRLHQDLADPAVPVTTIASAVRALLASGTAGSTGRHAGILTQAADRVFAALPQHRDGDLAILLATTMEVAASTSRGGEVVAGHVERLVNDNLAPAASGRLVAASATALGEAGRVLIWAPAFGVDAGAAALLRLQLAQELQERRRTADRPEVVAALAYGYADLLPAEARLALERRLRGWRVASLVPEYAAMHQLAWSRQPGEFGFTRFQLELRRVAALATPDGLAGQAALCLCLSTNFAAPGISGLHEVAD